jgi:hypothetical protein
MIVFGMVDTFERPWLLPLLALPALLLAWSACGSQGSAWAAVVC